MRARKSLPALMIAMLLLSACAGGHVIAPTAAVAPAEGPSTPEKRKAQINRQLAARCPTPGNLTGAELTSAADDLERRAVGDHWLRMASEYDRLDDESKACRGGSAPK